MQTPRAIFLVPIVAMAACVSTPPERPTPQGGGPGIVLEPSTYQSFEDGHRDKALKLQQSQRWADAALEWEILLTLAPQNADYQNQLKEAKARIAKGVDESLKSAEDARQHGDPQAGIRFYLRALSFDPTNSTAAESLRRIEQDSHRLSLHTRVARMSKETAAPKSAPASERRDVEFAVLLLRQGDYASSIKTLDKYLKASPKDELARRYLADAHFQLAQQRLEQGKKEDALLHLEAARGTHEQDAAELKASIDTIRKGLAEDYYQKGMKVYRANLDEAIVDWERSVQYDPTHPQATIRLQRARQMQQNLKAIDSSQQ